MLNIADDDLARSQAVRQMVHTDDGVTTAARAPAERNAIPHTIVQYWDDLSALPEDVAACLASWDSLQPSGFTRVLFDDKGARAFIAEHFGATHTTAYDRCPHPAMRADLFRLCYLAAVGGFYIDADEDYLGGDCSFLFSDSRLKVVPLCYDRASDSMVPTVTLASPREYSESWTYYVNNNPLVAPACHPVIEQALERAVNRLQDDENLTDVQGSTGPGNLTAVWWHVHLLTRGSCPARCPSS